MPFAWESVPCEVETPNLLHRIYQLANALDGLHKEYFEGTGIEIIPFSSVSREGKDELWNKIFDVL